MKVDTKILGKTPLAEGGEGFILEHDTLLLKVFKDSVNLNEKFEKLQRLMKKNLPLHIAKPLDIVFDQKDHFIGYAMEKVAGSEVKLLTNKKYCKINSITVNDILRILINIKNTLKELHAQDIFISDLNDKNILFDENMNTYFIDIDSWSVDYIASGVCMESYKDPQLISNQFSRYTDYYAFAVLVFTLLTRLHPFGGKLNPDMNLLDRMKKGISVINHPNVVIPKALIRDWSFMSPKLLHDLKNIYECGKRFLIDDGLEEMGAGLKLCETHQDYYYSQFDVCPVCNEDTAALKIVSAIVKPAGDKNIPYVLLFKTDGVKAMLNTYVYISNNGRVVHWNSGNSVSFDKAFKYYYSNDGKILYRVSKDTIFISYNGLACEYPKLNHSQVEVLNDKIYFVNGNCALVELTVTEKGNYIRQISKVSFNNRFKIIDEKQYFICNMYDNIKVLNIGGYNYEWHYRDMIVESGIHFDSVNNNWLLITQNQKGIFDTKVFNKNQLLFETQNLKYSMRLGNLCFNNNIMYWPSNGNIVGYSWERNTMKEFLCDIVNENAQLMKNHKSFTILTDDAVYQVG